MPACDISQIFAARRSRPLRSALLVALLPAVFSGCQIFRATQPRSVGEALSGYTYIPIDPFPVAQTSCPTSGSASEAHPSLQYFPDNAVRMSVEQFDMSGKVTYGPAGVGVKGGLYRVTIDYINADTTSINLWIKKTMIPVSSPFGDQKISTLISHKPMTVSMTAPRDARFIHGTEQYSVKTVEQGNVTVPFLNIEKQLQDEGYEQFNIPIYVGIGLRVMADIKTFDGKANISGLGVIGAEAEAGRLSGSLIVQTLGINGKSIAAALPIQSELNRTTTQNAIVAVGSIKALLYEKDTVVLPRIVGLYLPFPAEKSLLNAIISEIAKKQIQWTPPTNCGTATLQVRDAGKS